MDFLFQDHARQTDLVRKHSTDEPPKAKVLSLIDDEDKDLDSLIAEFLTNQDWLHQNKATKLSPAVEMICDKLLILSN